KQYVNPSCAVQVVKHDYNTKHAKKYVGTSMESDNLDYPKKNQASFMVINCGHPAWRAMTPDKVATMNMVDLLRLNFLCENEVGDLPPEWNHLVGEQPPNDFAKIAHFTLGVPGFKHYANCEFA